MATAKPPKKVTKEIIEKFELVPLLNGIVSLRSLSNHEIFHPGIGPEAEAKLLHVGQQKVVERARASNDFVLWDVGLGAAANAIAAVRAFSQLPSDYAHPITLESFDKSSEPLEFALKNAQALGYFQGFEAPIRQLIDQGSVTIGKTIRWNLHLNDFSTQLLTSKLRAPDAIFYDPYSAKHNAEMWRLSHFTQLYTCLDAKRPCLMTSYTASTYVRVTLLLAGFYVGVGCRVNHKLHTTVAANQLHLLEEPLDKKWLQKRVRISHSAAAMRNLPYEIAPISEEDYATLMQLPQFA